MTLSIFLSMLVAAVCNTIVGSIWYAPAVFGNTWMKEVGLKKNSVTKASMVSAMMTSFICYLVTGYVLLLIPHAFAGSLIDMLITVVVVWIGFIATVRLSHYAYEQKSFRLFWIVSLHDLLGLVVMGLVFWFWK